MHLSPYRSWGAGDTIVACVASSVAVHVVAAHWSYRDTNKVKSACVKDVGRELWTSARTWIRTRKLSLITCISIEMQLCSYSTTKGKNHMRRRFGYRRVYYSSCTKTKITTMRECRYIRSNRLKQALLRRNCCNGRRKRSCAAWVRWMKNLVRFHFSCILLYFTEHHRWRSWEGTMDRIWAHIFVFVYCSFPLYPRFQLIIFIYFHPHSIKRAMSVFSRPHRWSHVRFRSTFHSSAQWMDGSITRPSTALWAIRTVSFRSSSI